MVPGDVVRKLFPPEVDARLRGVGKAASFMPVPETAMDEDHGAAALHDDVRPAGEPGDVESIADAVGAQNAADGKLRSGVPTADGCHIGASASRGEAVGHECSLLMKLERAVVGLTPRFVRQTTLNQSLRKVVVFSMFSVKERRSAQVSPCSGRPGK